MQPNVNPFPGHWRETVTGHQRAVTLIELVQDAPWHHIYDFFANGNPPLAVRLLILNTIFFILFAYRRARGIPTMNPKSAMRVQTILIAANALLLFEPEIRDGIYYIDRLI